MLRSYPESSPKIQKYGKYKKSQDGVGRSKICLIREPKRYGRKKDQNKAIIKGIKTNNIPKLWKDTKPQIP